MTLHPAHCGADNTRMGRSPISRARRRDDDESGFTLVEAVVALFVLGIIFTALAAASMGSLARVAWPAGASSRESTSPPRPWSEREPSNTRALANRPADISR